MGWLKGVVLLTEAVTGVFGSPGVQPASQIEVVLELLRL